jgi:hypothetical protein
MLGISVRSQFEFVWINSGTLVMRAKRCGSVAFLFVGALSRGRLGIRRQQDQAGFELSAHEALHAARSFW